MPAPILNPDLRVPASVRRSVAAEGSATWRRAVPGGVVVLSTTRRGSRLVTSIAGLEISAPAEEVDELDFAML